VVLKSHLGGDKEVHHFWGQWAGRVLSEGEIKVSDKITLRRVALVQSLGYNLLSVSQLLDEGSEVLFRPGGSQILDSQGDLVCMVVPEGQVFRADFSQSSGVDRCFLASSSSELWRWHRKLGHLSFDLLSRLSLEKELVCAPCRHAKMVASSLSPLIDVMTEHPCELLHMDLVGPAGVRSAGGKRYVLVVVDDYSRYAWEFFLEDKGETFGFVRDLVLRLRNERHGDAIRAIRSDNGSEFRNSHFETFCHDLGLEHQFSSPYTSPQNGVVERKNRTLCEMARTMLDEHRTPRKYWAEAVNTACYVSDRIYLRVHKKKTCYELMHGRTPKVSHFHVFGCKCFILKKDRKLDSLRLGLSMVFSLVMHLTLEHIVCSILKLTKSWRLAR
jgi:transposase InsO family protein